MEYGYTMGMEKKMMSLEEEAFFRNLVAYEFHGSFVQSGFQVKLMIEDKWRLAMWSQKGGN